jgi:hypothetical protein
MPKPTRSGRGYDDGMNIRQSRTQFFVAAAVLAAMGLGFAYQGAHGAPPSFIGAAIFLVGAVIVVVWGLRRPHA